MTMPPVNLRRLSPEVLRNRYVNLHQQLQAALTLQIKQADRIKVLEAENRELHARLEDRPDG